jgi:membrane-bound serine protease (ClpP class)
MTLKQNILAPLMDPNVALIILVIGLFAIYFEFNHPGMVAPGVVGVIMVVVAIFALNLLPTRFAALGLILLSFVLFALEAKFTSHGALTLGGIATMIVGSLLLVDAPIPEMRVHVITALAISVPVGLITAFLVSIAWRARRNKVVTGTQGLLQQIGVARTGLNPAGRIFLHGELWNAIASSEVAPGEEVRVQRIDGLTVYVEPVRRAAAGQTEAGMK